MTLSLGQAAKEVGLDKSTLSRAIKRGRLSAQRTDSGGYAIDPAELFRVFPPSSQKPPALSPPMPTPPEALIENRELRIKLEAAELRLWEKDEEIRDLRRRLDAESDERRKLTLRLLAPPPPLSPPDSQERSVQTEAQHPVPPPAHRRQCRSSLRKNGECGHGLSENPDTPISCPGREDALKI
jgi:hypothetical protein